MTETFVNRRWKILRHETELARKKKKIWTNIMTCEK